MKLLLDQNLSAHAAVILRTGGIDAIHAREVSLATATDDAILERCRAEERVIVTRVRALPLAG